MTEKTVEIVEELMPAETPQEMWDIWDKQSPVVKRLIQARIEDVIDERLGERNALYFQQSEEGLEALAEELVREVAESLL